MQLRAPTPPDPGAADIATALRGAQRVVGHGPAVTVLLPSGRQEQGMASLAQWAAKGAHLIEADLLLQPGDRIRLDAPLSWTSAAVCLAAWWAGVAVTVDGEAEVTVIHEQRLRERPAQGEALTLGDAIDGSPQGEAGLEPWCRAVQAFPDHPPPPRATHDAPALLFDGQCWSQARLLERARAVGGGTVGIDAADISPHLGLLAVAVLPLVTGRPTVVLRGVERGAAAGDRVARWL